jgi:oligopeptide/dipeptide ABC transporter ATP-binding protein
MVERMILNGEVPRPVDIPEGAEFYTACPKVTKKCRVEEPKAMMSDSEHEVYCRLYS